MTTGLGTKAGESHPGDHGAMPSAVEAFRLYEMILIVPIIVFVIAWVCTHYRFSVKPR